MIKTTMNGQCCDETCPHFKPMNGPFYYNYCDISDDMGPLVYQKYRIGEAAFDRNEASIRILKDLRYFKGIGVTFKNGLKAELEDRLREEERTAKPYKTESGYARCEQCIQQFGGFPEVSTRGPEEFTAGDPTTNPIVYIDYTDFIMSIKTYGFYICITSENPFKAVGQFRENGEIKEKFYSTIREILTEIHYETWGHNNIHITINEKYRDSDISKIVISWARTADNVDGPEYV